VACRDKRSHIKTRAHSATAAKDGPFTAHLAAVAIKGGQTGERCSFTTIEFSQLRHLRQKQSGGAWTHSSDGDQFLNEQIGKFLGLRRSASDGYSFGRALCQSVLCS